jgi:hypothetical protein
MTIMVMAITRVYKSKRHDDKDNGDGGGDEDDDYDAGILTQVLNAYNSPDDNINEVRNGAAEIS